MASDRSTICVEGISVIPCRKGLSTAYSNNHDQDNVQHLAAYMHTQEPDRVNRQTQKQYIHRSQMLP